MRELTAECARELLAYDADTGVLTWKPRMGRGCRRDLDFKPAGSPHKDGYTAVTIDGKKYLAHRLIWLMLTGRWPLGEIDHRNGLRSDNRWVNLRDVTKGVNQQNRRGVTGVDFVKRTGKWRARITVDGRVLVLGHYDNEAHALDAYQTAKGQLHARV